MDEYQSRTSSDDIPVVTPRSVELLDANGSPSWNAVRPDPPRLRSRRRLALLLFVATCLSTFWVGMGQTAQADPSLADVLWSGFSYSVPIMLILLAHEMGHYLQARRYGVPATLPYFIPMPFIPFGTMGAVIVQGAGVADRKSLFDIAITGPIAGLVLALPIAYVGVTIAEFEVVPPSPDVLIFGEPPVLRWMIEFVHPQRPPGTEVLLNPLLFAGWVGIFVTALNLIPIGQLDGGHILYTLIGRRAHAVALSLLAVAVGWMVYTGYPAYGLMVVLLILMGPRHPPTADDYVPLGGGRVLLGWLTLAFLLIGFTLEPIKEMRPPERPKPVRQQQPGPVAEGVQPSHRAFMNASASLANCSSDENIRRQIFVAAARSGRASPNASTTNQPS